MTALVAPVAGIGRLTLAAFAAIGRIALFGGRAVSHLVRPPFYPREFLQAVLAIGWFSLPVVGLTALFTGGALALQIESGGARFNAESVVPSIVAIGMAASWSPPAWPVRSPPRSAR
jgi:phospholipid/cholesterol/gamma-HCH transport system permease protein